MRWIGQHIWDFVSRFRNDVYIEDLTELDQEFSVMIDADGKLTKSSHPGERSRIQVRNDEGSTIPAGAPLYSKGEIGGSERILVGICVSSDSAKMPCIGVAEFEMNTTDTKDSFAVTQGVYNTNISGFTGLSVGDTLYVNGGVAPHLTQTKPTNGDLIQNVGIVLKTNGTICQGLLVSAIGRTNDVPWPLYVDHTTQRVGIGTNSPSTKLHIEDSSHVYSTLQSTGANTEVAHKYRSSTLTSGYYWWTGLNNYDKYQIAYGTSFDNAGTALCIDTSGNVGIGQTDPQTMLHLTTAMSSSPTTKLYLDVDGSNIDGGGAEIIFNSSASSGTPTAYNAKISGTRASSAAGSSQLGFWTTEASINAAPQERMRIDKDGNVGIGTTSPSQKLHVIGDARIQGNLTVNGTYTQIDTDVNTTEQWLVTNDGTGPAAVINQLGTEDIFDVQDDGTSVFYIEDGGNIGIGTTNPTNLLHVQSATTNAVKINNSSNSSVNIVSDNTYLGLYPANYIVLGKTTLGYESLMFLKGKKIRWQEADNSYYDVLVSDGSDNLIKFGSVGDVSTGGDTAFYHDASEKMRLTSTGLGIGTTSPTDKLDVAGAIRLTQNVTFSSSNAGRIYKDAGHGLTLHGVAGTSNNFAFATPSGQLMITNPAGTNNVTIVPTASSASVGIGTSPNTAYKLHVAGKSYLSGGIQMNSGDEIDFGNSNQYITGVNDTSLTLATGGSATLTATHAGNVGIGTTSPGGKLDVAGNTDARVILGRAKFESHVSDYFYLSHFDQGSSTNYALNQSPTGSTSINAPTGQNVTLKINNSAKLQVQGATGNVGIGTTSPGFKLDVKTSSSDDGISLSATSGRKAIEMLIDNGTNGGGDIKMYTGTSVLTNRINAQGSSYINGGNVGIGHSSPVSNLHIYENSVDTNSAAGLTIEQAGTGDALAQFLLSGQRRWVVGADNSDVDKFKIASSIDLASDAHLTIDTAGKVGIGTTNPSSRLDVNGIGTFNQVRIGDSTTTNYGLIVNYADTRLLQLKRGGNTAFRVIADSSDGQVDIYDNSGNSDIRLHADNDSYITNNLGIGTTSPTEKLHVEGRLRLGTTPVIASHDTITIDIDQNNNQADNYFRVTKDGEATELFRVQEDGNVGIGTISPSEKLEVNGNIKVGDSDEVRFGAGNDLRIYHNGTNSNIENFTGTLQIVQTVDDEDITFRCDDGSGNTTPYITIDGSATRTNVHKDLRFDDNIGAVFGSGAALKLHSDGSNGLIDNYQGSLIIRQQVDDADIVFQCDDGSGSVETYFYLDGSLSSGNPFTVFPDESRLAIGDDADMIIYHNGSSSFITQKGTGDLYITNSTNDKDIIFQSDDGAGGLANYFRIDGSQAAHDGSASTALYTTWIDNSRIALGTDRDLHLHHTGSNSKITNYTGNLEIINNADDGDIKFSSDDGSGGTTEYFRLDGGDEKVKALKQLEVTGGVELTNGNLNMPDNSAIRLGSSTDLQIYHDGNHSYIVDAGTGDLLNYFSNEWKVIKYGSSETCIEATSDGSVDLYYDNNKKFETTSTGVEVTGNISLTGSVQKQIQVFPMNFVDDLGTDKHFMPFVTNTEQTVVYQEEAAMVMPADGRVVSVTVHYAQMDGTDGNITVGIETSACGQSYANPWTVEETETIAASVADDHHVFHFAFDNAKHFESTDKMAISIQQSTDMQSAARFFWVTAVVEYDWSTFLGGTSAEYTTTP